MSDNIPISHCLALRLRLSVTLRYVRTKAPTTIQNRGLCDIYSQAMHGHALARGWDLGMRQAVKLPIVCGVLLLARGVY